MNYTDMLKWSTPFSSSDSQPGGWGAMSGSGYPSYSLDPTQQMNPGGATGIPGMSSGMGGMAGMSDPKLGLNMGTAQLGLAGIGTIGNLWAAFKAQQLARDQFNYTKKITDTNLANQIQTYNTGIADRGKNRQIVEGRTPEETAAYVAANSLKKYGG